jgi:hypothetical protein
MAEADRAEAMAEADRAEASAGTDRAIASANAASCKPSTFCVINLKFGNRRAHSASTRCAWFGLQAAISERRQAYHSHTKPGSRANASAVASASGRKFRHKPPAPRKVGTPLAADTPAPVRTVTRASGVKRSIRRFTISDFRS